MKYVGVVHHESEKTYWFEAPEKLEPHIHINSHVLCDTRRGIQPGNVVAVMDGLERDEAIKIIGNYFPLRRVVGVFMNADISLVHIPWDMDLPEPTDVASEMYNFLKCGRFAGKVSFTEDMDLISGYAAYLVAKMLDHETLHGLCSIKGEEVV